MRVEILKEFKHGTETYYLGEVIVFPPEDTTGEYFCRAGWAEDLDGIVPTASPSTTDIILEIQPSIQLQQNSDLGV